LTPANRIVASLALVVAIFLVAPPLAATATAATLEINPTFGPPGQPVTITGAGFAPNSVVALYYDDSYSGYGSYTDSAGNTTSFAFIVPYSAVGDHILYLDDGYGNRSDLRTFTVTRPTAFAINPTSGPAGQPVTITGAGFAPNSVVVLYYDDSYFGYTSSTDSAGSITSLTFIVPASTVGNHTLYVIDGYGSRSDPQTFTVTRPTAFAISPASGPAGQPVTITGAGFASNHGVALYYDDSNTGYGSYTDNAGNLVPFVFYVPASTVVDHTLYVIDVYGNRSDARTFTVTRPTAFAISPTSGPAGQPVTITGAGFAPSNGVGLYYDDSYTGYGSSTDGAGSITSLTFIVPASPVGNHTFYVIDGYGNRSDSRTFTVTPPTAFAISPTSGPAGQLVTITGAGFAPGNGVGLYYDDSYTGYISSTDGAGSITSLTFIVPASTVGDHTLYVIDGYGNRSDSRTFTVRKPTTFAITPTSGPAGQLVTITGAGFAPGNGVGLYYDDSYTGYISSTDSAGSITSLTFIVPASTVGSHTLYVIDGYGNRSDPRTFTVTQPTIGICPTIGPAGQPVTITGTGFAPNNAVALYYDSSYTGYGGATNADGNIVAFQFTIPASAVGDHRIDLVDGFSNQASLTYTVTEGLPVMSVCINDVSLTEGHSGTKSFVFTVSRSGDPSAAASVDYVTADGTAASPSDYAAIPPTTLTFAPGEFVASITVVVNGDTVAEADETFSLNLSNCSACTIADGQATGTILNDDGPPTLSIDDVSLTEGDSGTKELAFTVTRSGDLSGASSVDYLTVDGTAASPFDYEAIPPTTLRFAADESSKTIAVIVNGDKDLEPDETFSLDLKNCAGCTIVDDRGIGTILNDDGAPIVSVNDVSLTEGDSGTKGFAFTVTRSGDLSGSSSVDYMTADGTAVSPSDYTAVPLSTLNFAPGEATRTITVIVNGDGTLEADETFFIGLSNCAGCTVADDQGIGTILNDDGPPTVSINDLSLTEGDSGTKGFIFTVTRSGDLSGASSVDYMTVDGTAVAPSDYAAVPLSPVSFAPGEATKSITVLVSGDTVVEPDENFSVTLSTCTGCILGDAQGIATIVNDDVVPPAIQTISFTSTPPLNLVVGDSYTPRATATSGLPVVITIDPGSASVCSIAGGVVTFNDTGSCVIDANQAGNAIYAAAPQVQQVVSVGDIVCAGAGIPPGFGVTARYSNRPGCGPNNLLGYNAIRLNQFTDGIIVCSWAGSNFPIPAGFTATARYSNRSGCGPNNLLGYNAIKLNRFTDGIIACSWAGSNFPIPAGFTATARYSNRSGCGPNNLLGYNAIKLNQFTDGIIACSWAGSNFPIAPEFAVTARYSSHSGCGPKNFWGYNAIRLNQFTDGIIECAGAGVPASIPPELGVTARFSNRSGCGQNNIQGYNAIRLNQFTDGIIVCSWAGSNFPIPPGFTVTARFSNRSGCGPNNNLGYNAIQLNEF